MLFRSVLSSELAKHRMKITSQKETRKSNRPELRAMCANSTDLLKTEHVSLQQVIELPKLETQKCC